MGGKPKVYITTLDYTLHCTVYYSQTCDGELLYCVQALRYQELLAVNQQYSSSSAAGCPVKNIQQTLDSLTQAGLSVAVYEEVHDVDAAGTGGRAGRIKQRVLAQVVTPGSPTYVYDACLRTDDLDFADSRPYVGVAASAGGYTMVEVYADARTARVSERLTEEALRTALEAGGAVEPLLVGSEGSAASSDSRSSDKVRVRNEYFIMASLTPATALATCCGAAAAYMRH
eukprot:8276-Heterococcus_DN1.PRE.3